MRADTTTPYILGLPVLGKQFFGRQNQIEHFFNMLNSQTLQPMRVMGLRRSGKTSFLHYLTNCNETHKLLNRKNQRTLIAYVDLQKGVTSVDDFCEAVIKAIYKVIPTECELPLKMKGVKTLSSWLESILDKNLRCVVLLDEYEVLTDIFHREFDISFFQYLRALCCNELLSYFTWTICSNIEISDISPQQRAHDTSSPFENIFNMKPIIIGGLMQNELRDLINKPIEKRDVKFNENEIRLIEEIAGSIPYFVQTIAQEMFLIKKRKMATIKLSESIIGALLYPNSNLDKLFNNYWKHFTEIEKGFLSSIFGEKACKRSYTHIEKKFLDYGLLKENGDLLCFNGNLFKLWFHNNIHIQGGIAVIHTDVHRLIERIDQKKELIDKLERRVTNLKAARALLNISTQRIEYDQHSEQINEIEITINDLNKEIYSKRNELLFQTFGESDINKLTSNIDDRLSLVSNDQVNTLLSDLVEIQVAIEKAGIQTPEVLYGIKEMVDSKKVTLNEKRTKVKLALSLLGPKVEIERTINDSTVKNLLSKFWKRIKTMILKEKD
jgi:hypothetical protein